MFTFFVRRLLRVRSDEQGQVLVVGVIVALGLAMVSLTVANVGMMVAEKIHVQDTVDAAAYSAAVVEARYLNLNAYLNRAVIANYDAMAFGTSLWATVAGYDHGVAPVISALYALAGIIQVLQVIPVVGPAFLAAAQAIDLVAFGLDNSLHLALHTGNEALGKLYGQNTELEQTDVNKYLEIFNTDIMTTYQGALFTAVQASRYKVVQKVARQMDPEISTTTVLNMGAETLNADEVKKAVDWIIDDTSERKNGMGVINDTFVRVMNEEGDEEAGGESGEDYDRNPKISSEDKPVMLGALIESSLDKFSSGRDRSGTKNFIRSFDFGNLIPPFVERPLEAALKAKCIFECPVEILLDGACDCDTDVGIQLGAKKRDGEEDSFLENYVPVYTKKRMREVNSFGVDIDLDIFSDALGVLGFPTRIGYTSGHNKEDIANIDNLLEPVDIDAERALQCLLFRGRCTLNAVNIALSELGLMGIAAGACSAASGNQAIDDHWDGNTSARPTCAFRLFQGQICTDQVQQYITNICQQTNSLDEGVPKYDLLNNLPSIGFAHYDYDETGAPSRPQGISSGDENNLLAGPSVAVVGVKKADRVNGLRGLGIGNQKPFDYPVSALARAQVYYLRNPNRPNERPNMFNPFWAARLAPIESEETPMLLKRGLPYLMSFGNPLRATH